MNIFITNREHPFYTKTFIVGPKIISQLILLNREHLCLLLGYSRLSQKLLQNYLYPIVNILIINCEHFYNQWWIYLSTKKFEIFTRNLTKIMKIQPIKLNSIKSKQIKLNSIKKLSSNHNLNIHFLFYVMVSNRYKIAYQLLHSWFKEIVKNEIADLFKISIT